MDPKQGVPLNTAKYIFLGLDRVFYKWLLSYPMYVW